MNLMIVSLFIFKHWDITNIKILLIKTRLRFKKTHKTLKLHKPCVLKVLELRNSYS